MDKGPGQGPAKGPIKAQNKSKEKKRHMFSPGRFRELTEYLNEENKTKNQQELLNMGDSQISAFFDKYDDPDYFIVLVQRLDREVLFGFLQRTPVNVLKNIFLEMTDGAIKLLKERLGISQTIDLLVKFFPDLAGPEIKNLDKRIGPELAEKLADRLKHQEEEIPIVPEGKLEIEQQDVESILGKEKPVEPEVVVIDEADEIPNTVGNETIENTQIDIDNTRVNEIIKPEEEDGSETQEFEIPDLGEKSTPENLEIGGLIGTIEKDGYHVTPLKTEPRKAPEDIIADLKKLKEIIIEAKKEQARRLEANETIAIENSNPILSKWVSIGGYDLSPNWGDIEDGGNGKVHKDVETAIGSIKETHSMSKEEKLEDKKLGIRSPQDVEVEAAFGKYLKTEYPWLFEKK